MSALQDRLRYEREVTTLQRRAEDRDQSIAARREAADTLLKLLAAKQDVRLRQAVADEIARSDTESLWDAKRARWLVELYQASP